MQRIAKSYPDPIRATRPCRSGWQMSQISKLPSILEQVRAIRNHPAAKYVKLGQLFQTYYNTQLNSRIELAETCIDESPTIAQAIRRQEKLNTCFAVLDTLDAMQVFLTRPATGE